MPSQKTSPKIPGKPRARVLIQKDSPSDLRAQKSNTLWAARNASLSALASAEIASDDTKCGVACAKPRVTWWQNKLRDCLFKLRDTEDEGKAPWQQEKRLLQAVDEDDAAWITDNIDRRDEVPLKRAILRAAEIGNERILRSLVCGTGEEMHFRVVCQLACHGHLELFKKYLGKFEHQPKRYSYNLWSHQVTQLQDAVGTPEISAALLDHLNLGV